MKAGNIIDAAIEMSHRPLIIQLPNGQQLTTKDYHYGHDKRGEPVLVIDAGKAK